MHGRRQQLPVLHFNAVLQPTSIPVLLLAVVAHPQTHPAFIVGMPSSKAVLMLIPAAAVGLLIGKAGQFLKYIGHVSGATLKLQSFDEMALGTQERVLVVIGEDMLVVKCAVQVILMRLQTQHPMLFEDGGDDDDDDNHNNAMHAAKKKKKLVKWIIPQSAAGLLIGKQGSRIKMINDKSGAWVKLAHPEELAPSPDERFVYIRGTDETTTLAATMVQMCVGGRPAQTGERIAIPRSAVPAVQAALAGWNGGGGGAWYVDDNEPVVTGVSSVQVVFSSPATKDGGGVSIKSRIRECFPTPIPRLLMDGSSPDEDKLKVEMCVVFLMPTSSATDGSRADVLFEYEGRLLHRVHVMGPLSSVLDDVDTFQQDASTVVPAVPLIPTSSSSELNRRKLSSEELLQLRKQRQSTSDMLSALAPPFVPSPNQLDLFREAVIFPYC